MSVRCKTKKMASRRRCLTSAAPSRRSGQPEPHLPHCPRETREPRRRHLQRGVRVSPAGAVGALTAPCALSPSLHLCRHCSEKCVMNNYFGIGLDAKISLEFNNKRDEHPKKCRYVRPGQPLVPGTEARSAQNVRSTRGRIWAEVCHHGNAGASTRVLQQSNQEHDVVRGPGDQGAGSEDLQEPGAAGSAGGKARTRHYGRGGGH